LKEEMGFTTALNRIFDFTYHAEFDNGLTEFEYDHVFLGVYNGPVNPNPEEVQDYRYQSMEEVRAAVADNPAAFTAWFHIALPLLEKWLLKNKLEMHN
jgi:isopentenyl-diphosphate delta-isomerase